MTTTKATLLLAGAVAAIALACGKGAVGVPGSGGNGGGNKSGGPGPWPVANVTYGAANGIREAPIVGVSTDETQNLWVATHAALYLLKPGESGFRRFDVHDGLHLKGNPVSYCDRDFAGGDKSCPIQGQADDNGIAEITGGGDNEVFVGYSAPEPTTGDWSDPGRHDGKLDRVRLTSNGLQVDRFDMVSSGTPEFWHDRTVERMLYDHFTHAHELYVGTNHGVDRLQPDNYRAPKSGEWFLDVDKLWMSDHLHPRVCYRVACDNSESNQRMGDWRGLAMAPDGNLWVGGKWSGGKIRYSAALADWHTRPGSQAYAIAFGDPYDPNTGTNPPIWQVAFEGDTVSVSAVAVGTDGRVWFASGPQSTQDKARGIAAWDGHSFQYFSPQQAGLADASVSDLVALPDGRLVVSSPTSGAVIWDPKSGAHTALALPDPHVLRMELDAMVSPPALHVATYGGAAVLRQLP